MSSDARTKDTGVGQSQKYEGRMYGVVLWSDQNKNRAVIWCEDHGDLAFFKGDERDGFIDSWIDPGDLVRFDLKEDNQMRLARNLALVSSDEYPTLAHYLKTASDEQQSARADTSPVSAREAENRIIPFSPIPGSPASTDKGSQRKAL